MPLRPIDINKEINQSELVPSNCKCCQAQENACPQVMTGIGIGFMGMTKHLLNI